MIAAEVSLTWVTRSRMLCVYDENPCLALSGTLIMSPAGTLMSFEINFCNRGRNIVVMMRTLKASLCLATRRMTAALEMAGSGRTAAPSGS